MEATAAIGLTETHLFLFGKVVQLFAAHELLIRQIIAHVLGTQPDCIAPLTRNLPFEHKCKVLLELLRHHSVPLDQYDHINFYLKRPLASIGLRDDIIHSPWAAATPPDMIQPASILQPPARVKPVQAGAAPSHRGFATAEDEKYAYSIKELQEVAAALESNWKGFSAYLAEAGLVGGAPRA